MRPLVRAEPSLLGRLPRQERTAEPASFRLAEEATFKELSDAAHDAFVAFDRAGLIRSWNTAAARMFGYTGEEVLGRHTTMLVAEVQVELQQARVGRVLEGERIYSVNAAGRRRDGAVMPMRLTLVPGGEGGGGRLMARDLTEEHLAQVTLTEAEVRPREAQELSHVGLWLWDSASDSLQISDELYRTLGVSPLNFQGTMASYMAYVHPEDRTACFGADRFADIRGRQSVCARFVSTRAGQSDRRCSSKATGWHRVPSSMP